MAVTKNAPRVGYFPDNQEWHKAPGGEYWLGIDTHKRPGPDDLVREKTIPGHAVCLGDGQQWIVPIARQVVSGSVLPQQGVLNADGEWELVALPEYAALWADASRVWKTIVVNYGWEERTEDHRDFTIEELFDLACRVLTTNYYLNRFAISALGLLRTDNAELVSEAVVDIPGLIELLKAEAESKKKSPVTSDTGNTDSGEQD